MNWLSSLILLDILFLEESIEAELARSGCSGWIIAPILFCRTRELPD
jgi:hypothetical protein